MAQDTKHRPEFPDPDRPLYTPDVGAQRQVVERIKQACKGKRARAKKKTRDAASGAVVRSIHVVQRRGLPMGQHPYVGREVLADEWGVGHTTASELAEHPEKLDPWQVRQLCDLCGVTLEWLRGWEDENAYGRYETAETIAAMYGHLSNEDRRLVTDLLTRLLGANTTRAIKDRQWARDNSEWLDRHPEEAQQLERTIQEIQGYIETLEQIHTDEVLEVVRMADRAADRMNDEISKVARIADATRATLESAIPVQDIARAIKDRHTPEEWDLIESTADRLKAQGVDAGRMKPDELLAYARGDSMEG